MLLYPRRRSTASWRPRPASVRCRRRTASRSRSAGRTTLSAEFFRSLWGPYSGVETFPDVCAATARRGYAGIETNPVFFAKQLDEAQRIVADHGLKFLARAHTFGDDVDAHLGWVRRCVDAAVAFGSPHVIVQSGDDRFTDAQVDEYFRAAATIEAESGLRLAHETHRGCILYSPWVTARVLDRFPEVWLASDYSHWVIVTEGYMPFDDEILARCANRTIHIDARVGTPESPQVPDPRLEEAAESLGWFDRYWDEIHAAAAARGDGLTVVPEFGPPPYEPPGAGDRDDICQWMADRLRDRWSA